MHLNYRILIYRGGYITEEYGSSQGGDVDAIQIEVPGEIRYIEFMEYIEYIDYIGHIYYIQYIKYVEYVEYVENVQYIECM